MKNVPIIWFDSHIFHHKHRSKPVINFHLHRRLDVRTTINHSIKRIKNGNSISCSINCRRHSPDLSYLPKKHKTNIPPPTIDTKNSVGSDWLILKPNPCWYLSAPSICVIISMGKDKLSSGKPFLVSLIKCDMLS